MIRLLKLLPLSGIIGVIFYFLHIFFGSLFYADYNPLTQAISDLTAINSPSRNIAMPFSVLYGIFSIVFSTSFLIYLKGKINKLITLGAYFFCSMTIISFFGYTFFPLSEAGYAGTFQDKIHMIVTVLVVLFTITFIVLFSFGFFRTANYKCLGIISIITFILLLSGAMLINLLPAGYFGLAQRINAYSTVLYTGILSYWMYKNAKQWV